MWSFHRFGIVITFANRFGRTTELSYLLIASLKYNNQGVVFLT